MGVEYIPDNPASYAYIYEKKFTQDNPDILGVRIATQDLPATFPNDVFTPILAPDRRSYELEVDIKVSEYKITLNEPPVRGRITPPASVDMRNVEFPQGLHVSLFDVKGTRHPGRLIPLPPRRSS